MQVSTSTTGNANSLILRLLVGLLVVVVVVGVVVVAVVVAVVVGVVVVVGGIVVVVGSVVVVVVVGRVVVAVVVVVGTVVVAVVVVVLGVVVFVVGWAVVAAAAGVIVVVLVSNVVDVVVCFAVVVAVDTDVVLARVSFTEVTRTSRKALVVSSIVWAVLVSVAITGISVTTGPSVARDLLEGCGAAVVGTEGSGTSVGDDVEGTAGRGRRVEGSRSTGGCERDTDGPEVTDGWGTALGVGLRESSGEEVAVVRV